MTASFGTGDINLACALMSLGVPLKEPSPCTLIAHENGHIYSRYHFEGLSVNGRYKAGELSQFWDKIGIIPCDHPLRIISEFVLNAPKGLKLSEWFDYAHTVFSIGHIVNFEDAQRHIAAFPENPESYCLAFILNRRELLSLHYRANRETFMSRNGANALIGVNMPKHQKQELINRLNG